MEPLFRYQKIVKGKAKPKFHKAKFKELKNFANLQLASCELCEWHCQIERATGRGECKATDKAKVLSTDLDWSLEQEFVPAATIEFAENIVKNPYSLNQRHDTGKIWKSDTLIKWIKDAKKCGAKCLIFKNPEPNIPFIVEVLSKLKINIPIVFSTSGFYSEYTAKIIQDIVDVYYIDWRYGHFGCAEYFIKAPSYPEILKRNILFAKDQGELLIKILLLPGHVECDAKPILAWILENNINCKLQILSNYTPTPQSKQFPEMGRKVSITEYKEVVDYASALGFEV